MENSDIHTFSVVPNLLVPFYITQVKRKLVKVKLFSVLMSFDVHPNSPVFQYRKKLQRMSFDGNQIAKPIVGLITR